MLRRLTAIACIAIPFACAPTRTPRPVQAEPEAPPDMAVTSATASSTGDATKPRGFTCPDSDREGLVSESDYEPWKKPKPAPSTSASTSSSAKKPARVLKMIETATSIQGPIEPPPIKGTIRNSFPRLRKCYEEALARDRSTTGLVVTEFMIGSDGLTLWADARSDGTTIADQEMLTCVERVFACFSYPQATKHPPGKVFVHYPIRFETEAL